MLKAYILQVDKSSKENTSWVHDHIVRECVVWAPNADSVTALAPCGFLDHLASDEGVCHEDDDMVYKCVGCKLQSVNLAHCKKCKEDDVKWYLDRHQPTHAPSWVLPHLSPLVPPCTEVCGEVS